MFRPLSLYLLLIACLMILAAPISAQEKWEIRPNYEYNKTSIMIAPFQTTGTALEPETLSQIIRHDLLLTGFFNMPPDQRMANVQNQIDHRQGSINFDFWRNELNVEHYVMAGVTEEGGNYRARVVMYDIQSRQLIMNREFTDTKTRARQLGHAISDAITLQLKGVEGVARTKLLYVTELVPGTKEIAIMDWDGYDAHPLTSYGKLATLPTWGSKGSEIYFVSYHKNLANIYGMQLRADPAFRLMPGESWTIAAYGGTNHSPAWSHTAHRIAMILSKDGNSEIYTVGRDGQDLRRLTKTTFTEGSPVWSPDGSKIAFTSNEAGGVHVFVMNADGSGKRQLTKNGSWNDAISWSPEGSRLVYVKRASGKNDIYITDTNGEDSFFRRLTMGQGNNESPVWAPNGTHIAFASDRTGQWQIYIMLDDGSNQAVLTSVGRSTLPDWSPFFGQ